MKSCDACVCALTLVMSDSLRPWTTAHQAPLSMGFFRQEYWSGLPCPSPGNFPDSGIEPVSSVAPTLQVDSYCWATGEAWKEVRDAMNYPIVWQSKSTQSKDLLWSLEKISREDDMAGPDAKRMGPCLGLGAYSPCSLRWIHDDLQILSFSFVRWNLSSLLSFLLSLL